MKGLLSAMLAAGIAITGIATAEQVEVTSSNIVGVIRLEIPAGFSLISTPFNRTGGAEQTLGDLFGDGTQDGLEAIFFDGAQYAFYTFAQGVGWVDDDFNTVAPALARGGGFWIRATQPFTLTMTGEVPLAAVHPVTLRPGFQIVSHAYPTDRALDEADIDPTDGDEIIRFDAHEIRYESATYAAGVGWVDDDFNLLDITLLAGESYWYVSRAGDDRTWEQRRSFDLP